MRLRQVLLNVFVAFSLVSCGGDGGGGNGGGNGYSCTLPCLASQPGLSATTLSTATGGIVDMTFSLTGDALNVVVFLFSTDPFSLNQAGNGFLINPAGGIPHILSIVVDAGTPVDTYYPVFAITANTNNSGGEYYLDPTKSQSRYTYAEVVNGQADTPVLSPFTIPRLQVQ